jgi:hypothetical protein
VTACHTLIESFDVKRVLTESTIVIKLKSICQKARGGRGVKLTTHLHLVPSLRMCGAISPLPNTPSWLGT